MRYLNTRLLALGFFPPGQHRSRSVIVVLTTQGARYGRSSGKTSPGLERISRESLAGSTCDLAAQ
ncbi:hypothetical protein C0Q70_05143 [Pomacea canaliculata]|uniref:Uncharacterized protein n=1 Tax=Pomacea canaliculata TaxID=400727 RepID=A0A2T7PKC3_POMCA|nr:hypothetical protein C0Q70_05143 [Pomacea canaliculata]